MMARQATRSRFDVPPPALSYTRPPPAMNQPPPPLGPHHKASLPLSDSDEPNPPQPPPPPKQDEEDGWSFWTRVYETPELRAEAQAAMFEGPTVSEVISNERRRRSQMILENVPPAADGGEQSVRELLQTRCPNMTVLNVRTNRMQHKAYVFFVRSENAAAAAACLNGIVFKHHRLIARVNGSAPGQLSCAPAKNVSSVSAIVSEPDVKSGPSKPPNEPFQNPSALIVSYPQLASPPPPIFNPEIPPPSIPSTITITLQSDVLCPEMVAFARSLLGLLAANDGRVELGSECLAQTVDDHVSLRPLYLQWPTGLLRLLVLQFPNVFVLNRNQLALYNNNNIMTERDESALCEDWEPLAVEQIQSKEQLRSYVHALVTHFGKATGGDVFVLSACDAVLGVLCMHINVRSVSALFSHLQAIEHDHELPLPLLIDTDYQQIYALPSLCRAETNA